VGTFNTIISYFVFVVIIFIALTVIALFLLRRKAPEGAAYRTPGYPLTPVIFLSLIALLLLLLAGNNPLQAFLGVGVVALGLPVYYLLFRNRSV
jgi:APA family basic amino acid/polyamine antiporter